MCKPKFNFFFLIIMFSKTNISFQWLTWEAKSPFRALFLGQYILELLKWDLAYLLRGYADPCFLCSKAVKNFQRREFFLG